MLKIQVKKPRSEGPWARKASMFQDIIQDPHQFGFGHQALDLPERLAAAVKEHQVRNSGDVVFIGQLEILVNVDLAHLDAPGELPGEAVDDWRQPVARWSTRSPELDQDWLMAANHLRRPVVESEFHGLWHGASSP